MESLTLKVRISVLWIFMGVAGWRCVHFMEAGLVEQVLSGEMQISAGEWLFMAFFWLIPLTMAFLSVTLKDVANRWANIILGIVFTLLNIFHLAEHLAQPVVHQILIVASTVVVAVLIVWYAWKWPKQEA